MADLGAEWRWLTNDQSADSLKQPKSHQQSVNGRSFTETLRALDCPHCGSSVCECAVSIHVMFRPPGGLHQWFDNSTIAPRVSTSDARVHKHQNDGPTVKSVREEKQVSSLHHDCDRFRGDWFACSSFIASVAEQVGECSSAGVRLANVSFDSISVGQLGQAVLRRTQPTSAQVAADISHLPPEQVESVYAIPDASAHVYSIGVLFYRILCGRPPFNATDEKELKRQIRADLPQPPRQLIHNVPTEVESICLRALEKDSARRQATPWELATALRKAISTAEDSMGGVSHSALEAAPVEPVVERRFLAVFLCKLPPGFESGLAEHCLAGHCLAGVQSAVENCLGASRVRRAGCRLLVEAASDGGESDDGASIAKILSDILECMAAIRSFLASQEDAPALDVNVRLATAVTDFADAAPEQLPYSATALRASIDGTSIRLTANSRATLRRWLGSSDASRAVALGVDVLAELDDATIDETPFVGREPQLGMLASRWAQILEGRKQVVLLIGDEGAGKSRLLSEFADRLIQSGSD